MIEKWINAPGSVLVGTEMALLYIDRRIDNVGIVSLDSYLSIPDFRMGEKVFSMISKMRSLASKRFILQTRKPDEKVLSYASRGNMADFYREELTQRNELGFPPKTFIIKISNFGKKEKVLSNMEELKIVTEGYSIDVFPAFVSLPRGLVSMHCLIRLPKGAWPDKNLIEKLLSLPPSYTVNVDPESLL
jgi:primosomal protein N'